MIYYPKGSIIEWARGWILRVFKTRSFQRFARKEKIGDSPLRDAISRAQGGFVDADLGSGVIKQRVARPGQGRSGGYRTLIAFRSQLRSVFLFGFAKSERDNIEDHELKKLRQAADEMLNWSDAQVDKMLLNGGWTEIHGDDGEEDAQK